MQSQLVILRRSFLEVVQEICSSLRVPAQFCAAKLLDYFLHWTDWKMKVYHHFRIERRMVDIRKDLMHEYSLHTIREAIGGLVEAGLLHQESDPNGQSKTWHYWLGLERLLQMLKPEGEETNKLLKSLNQLWIKIQAKIQLKNVRSSDSHTQCSDPEAYKPLPLTSSERQRLKEASQKENLDQPNHFGQEPHLDSTRSIKNSPTGEDNYSAPPLSPVEKLSFEQEQLLDDAAAAIVPDSLTPTLQIQILSLSPDKVRGAITEMKQRLKLSRAISPGELLVGLLCSQPSDLLTETKQQLDRLGWTLEKLKSFTQEQFGKQHNQLFLEERKTLLELLEGL
jgi:hypothetical protein